MTCQWCGDRHGADQLCPDERPADYTRVSDEHLAWMRQGHSLACWGGMHQACCSDQAATCRCDCHTKNALREPPKGLLHGM